MNAQGHLGDIEQALRPRIASSGTPTLRTEDMNVYINHRWSFRTPSGRFFILSISSTHRSKDLGDGRKFARRKC